MNTIYKMCQQEAQRIQLERDQKRLYFKRRQMVLLNKIKKDLKLLDNLASYDASASASRLKVK